jgi:hypothetical protein
LQLTPLIGTPSGVENALGQADNLAPA